MLTRVSRKLSHTAACLGSIGLLLGGSRATGQPAKVAAQRGFPSLVLLAMEDAHNQPVSLGSGFVVAPGIIATNMHVVLGAADGSARLVGQRQQHPINGALAADEANDLVLLSVPGITSTPSLKLADSSKIGVGDEVFALGNPLGLEGTISSGIVSGLREAGDTSIIQIQHRHAV